MDDHDLNSAGMLFEDDDDTEVSINYHPRYLGRGTRGPSSSNVLNNGTSAFSTNAQSWFVSVVLDGVLGPLRLALRT